MEQTTSNGVTKEKKREFTYDAKAVVLERDEEGKWKEREVRVFNRKSFLDVFKDERDTLTQVNLDRHRKVYYCSSNIKTEILSKVRDENEEMFYMGSPLLLVECDDINPIDIRDEVKEEIKREIELY